MEVGVGRLVWNSPSPLGYVIVDISTEAVARAVHAGVCDIIGDGESLLVRAPATLAGSIVICHPAYLISCLLRHLGPFMLVIGEREK